MNFSKTKTIDESESTIPDQIIIKSKSTASIKELTELPKIRPPKKTQKMSKLLRNIMKPQIRAKKKYFTAGPGVNEGNAIDLDKEPSPYKYPKDLEQFAYKVRHKAWREDIRVKELKLKCHQKPSYQERHKRGLLNRLYVKEPKVESMKTVLDLDPQFFSLIEGRPIPDKIDIRSYINLVRETLRAKIICGYREDDILVIEENILLEQKMIDKIKENLQTYINIFEEFLYRDHTSAMELLKNSEAASEEANRKYEEYRKLGKEFSALRSSLYNSEEKWRNCQIYQKFLHRISPMSWKQKNRRDITRSSVFLEDDLNDDNMFGIFKEDIQETSLSDLIVQLRENKDFEAEPQLYFTDPEQLMDVFRVMEMQNLHSLLHSEELAIPLDNVKEAMRVAEQLFDEEIKQLQESINRLAGSITWEEERAKYLEDFAISLIQNEFKQLVKSDDVLNLHVFVEDVYETRIGPNDANLSMLEMMKGIEEKYRHELLLLDQVPSEQVALLEGTCYAEQMRIMRLAEKAAKQYTELERLTYRLNRAFAPSHQKKGGKEPKKRSPLMEPKKAARPPPRNLTETEEQYLEYFTDFCKFTDNPEDYGIDTRASGESHKAMESRQEISELITIDKADFAKYGAFKGMHYLQKLMFNM